MKRIAMLGLLMMGAFTAAGCRTGVNSEETFDVKPDTLKVTDLPAGTRLEATYTATDNVAVKAYLVAKEDADAALAALSSKGDMSEAMKAVKKIISESDKSSGKLSSPKYEKKTQLSILFTSQKPTKVTVKTTGDR